MFFAFLRIPHKAAINQPLNSSVSKEVPYRRTKTRTDPERGKKMSKKVILGIVAAVLLLGAENLFAQEREANERAERAGRVAGHKRMEGVQQKHQGFRPVQERFDKWFRKLTKAYEDNDREKMGQLLRKMHQFREGQTKAKDAVGERRQAPATPVARRGCGQDFHSRARARKREAGQFRGGLGGRGQGIQGRGMGGQGQDFPARGIGRRGQGLQRRGIGGPDPDTPRRGMGRHGQGLQHTGMGRPDPDMPHRGMGRRQQRIPGGQRGYRNPGFPHGGMHNWRQGSHRSEWDW